MDLAIRQSLQRVLEQAIHEHALITIQCTDGRLLKVRCDLTCFETNIGGTDQDVISVNIPYSRIANVGISEPSGPDRISAQIGRNKQAQLI
jgi:hypothetical protein